VTTYDDQPSRREPLARAWFGLTALAVLVGLVVQVHAVWDVTDGRFAALHSRVVNVFCYFTVQSNILVGVTCLLLALRLDRRSTVFGVLRLDGLVAITVTFVVFHLTLAQLQDLEGAAKVADSFLHTLVPLMCVVGWLAFGPRRSTTWRVVWLSLVFPLAWCAFALVRGPIVDFYPYPFIDVRDLGYPRVIANCVLVGVLFVGLAAVAHLVDVRLSRRHQPSTAQRRRQASDVG
jgi:hypothetical protein